MFEWGETVIDTKRRVTPQVVSTMDSAHGILYVLYDWEAKEYYIATDEHLIPYEEYWFDNN